MSDGCRQDPVPRRPRHHRGGGLHRPRGRQALHRAHRRPRRTTRPRDRLHPRGGQGVPRHRRRQGPHRPLHLDPPPRGRRVRRHRRPRPGRHRPPRVAAGDGGQVRAVQGVRRPRLHPAGARDHRRRRDRRHDRPPAPELRGGQPRGHRRPALLRDRAPADRGARLPGDARRPARHGDRGARRPAQRRPRPRPRPRRAQGRRQRGRGLRGRLREDPALGRGARRGGARLPRRHPRGPRRHERREDRPRRDHEPPRRARRPRRRRSTGRTSSWACPARRSPSR